MIRNAPEQRVLKNLIENRLPRDEEPFAHIMYGLGTESDLLALLEELSFFKWDAVGLCEIED